MRGTQEAWIKTKEMYMREPKMPPLSEEKVKELAFKTVLGMLRACIQGTSFTQGLFTDAELSYANYQSVTEEIAFFDRLISFLDVFTGKQHNVEGRTLVGLRKDTASLHTLLQEFNKLAHTGKSSSEAVRKTKKTPFLPPPQPPVRKRVAESKKQSKKKESEQKQGALAGGQEPRSGMRTTLGEVGAEADKPNAGAVWTLHSIKEDAQDLAISPAHRGGNTRGNDEMVAELEKLHRELGGLRVEESKGRSEVTRLENEKAELKRKLREVEYEQDDLAKFQAIQTKFQEQAKEYEALKAQNVELQQAQETKEADLKEMRNKVSIRAEEIATKAKECQDLIESLKKQNEELKTQIAQGTAAGKQKKGGNAQEHQATLAALTADIENENKECEELTSILNNLLNDQNSRIEELNAILSNRNAQLQQLHMEEKKLEEELKDLRSRAPMHQMDNETPGQPEEASKGDSNEDVQVQTVKSKTFTSSMLNSRLPERTGPKEEQKQAEPPKDPEPLVVSSIYAMDASQGNLSRAHNLPLETKNTSSVYSNPFGPAPDHDKNVESAVVEDPVRKEEPRPNRPTGSFGQSPDLNDPHPPEVANS